MRPYKVLLFIFACLAVMAVLCVALPHRVEIGDRSLKWPTLAEVFETEPIATLDSLEIPDTPGTPEIIETPASPDTPDTPATEAPKPEIVVPKVVVDSTIDCREFLRPFYEVLSESDRQIIRVLHYGDSQIEEDRMTQQIREALQARYGGAGVGLMPLAQTIPSLSVKQQLFMSERFVLPTQGPRRYMVYAPKRDQRTDKKYGVMGQMAQMNDSLVSGSEDIMAVCTPQGINARYTQWKIFADTSIHSTTHGDTVWLNGKGAVYGLSQQTETGVIVDNLPMRGCLGTVFTKIDKEQLQTFYEQENVRLIILQFGGNAIPSNKNPGTIAGIVKGLRDQVRYLKSCAPEASILFIGPSDMLTQIDGEWQTYPMVPYMDGLLRKMALEENIAYFSLYRWMGGSGSMLRWQEVGLAGSDGVHFTRAGAKKAGKAVANWILEGIEMTNNK